MRVELDAFLNLSAGRNLGVISARLWLPRLGLPSAFGIWWSRYWVYWVYSVPAVAQDIVARPAASASTLLLVAHAGRI